MLVLRLLSFLAFCCLCCPIASATVNTVNKIVAVVNGEMITLHELRARAAMELAREGLSLNDPKAVARMPEFLKYMISDILLKQEAEKKKLVVTDQEIEPELRKIIRRSRLSQKDFEAKLVSQGTSLADLREQIKNNILRKRIFTFMVAKKIFISNEQIRDFYETHKSKYVSEKTADFSLIVFSSKVNAEKIYATLKANPNQFEEIAKKYSVEPHAKEGGRLGPIPWENLPPPMRQLFSQMKPGQLTPIVRIENGLGVIRLNEITPGGVLLPFEEVKDLVEEELREPLIRERLDEYVQQLRSKAVVEIRL